jgi:hypothetical protein
MVNLPTHLRSRLVSILTTVMLTFVITATSLAQTLKVLHDFGVTAGDGNLPSGPLLKDAAGNLYGMTSAGGVPGVRFSGTRQSQASR